MQHNTCLARPASLGLARWSQTDKKNRNLDHYKLASWIATKEYKSEAGDGA